MNLIELRLEDFEIDTILKLLERKIEKLQSKKLDQKRVQKIREFEQLVNNIKNQVS